MARTPVSDEVPSPRVGRPARINRQMIAAAAHELGLERLTLRAVADHLDVSIAALYHHVSSKDDLMRAAAEYSAGRVPLPDDTGQPWAVWLLEWAFYNHDVFASQPGLLAEYLDGAISEESIAPSLDRILGGLVRRGFTPREAEHAYQLVAATALGTVMGEVRAQAVATDATAPEEVAHPQALEAGRATAMRRSFEDCIVTVLRGLAAERGDPWPTIAAELGRAVRRRR